MAGARIGPLPLPAKGKLTATGGGVGAVTLMLAEATPVTEGAAGSASPP